ncbi:MAG: type II toxin-antitoxin system VapC family toxin [Acidimicrobiia bacterium]|nr:type II toxin-antitoxin system VapC family toxin [Acidimicrobiia bacterium]MYB44586.1 type II toxin-antitoxin system VapC family toxin [Acidimicrobiia bacterium]MYC85294.1 type II toxin-antitoxin system VapC family toxin [Acidimicrobiia bacterium]
MRLLLDTHALLWWWTNNPGLSALAHNSIADGTSEVFVSAASAWEIATLRRLGRLDHAPDAIQRFHELVTADEFHHLAITYTHCLRAGSYTAEHRDPFDRMLAAQSEMESLTLVTKDPAFGQFGTTVIW